MLRRTLFVVSFVLMAILGVGSALFGQGYVPTASAAPILPDGGAANQGKTTGQHGNNQDQQTQPAPLEEVGPGDCAPGDQLLANLRKEKPGGEDFKAPYSAEEIKTLADREIAWIEDNESKPCVIAVAKNKGVTAKELPQWMRDHLVLKALDKPLRVQNTYFAKDGHIVLWKIQTLPTGELVWFNKDGSVANKYVCLNKLSEVPVIQTVAPKKFVGPVMVYTIHKTVIVIPPTPPAKHHKPKPPVKTCQDTHTCPVQECKNGSTGPFPQCPLPCPNGNGNQPNCQMDTCTNGSSGPYPACPLPSACDKSKHPKPTVGEWKWSWKKCDWVPIPCGCTPPPDCHVTHTCPPPPCNNGEVGVPGHCHPPTCSENPNQDKCKTCPTGTQGHYPDCKPKPPCGCTTPGEVQQQPTDGGSTTTPGAHPTPPSSSTPTPTDNRDHGSGATPAPAPTHNGSDSGSPTGSTTPSGTHTGDGHTSTSSGSGNGHVSDAQGGNNGTDGGNTSTGDGQISNPFGNG